MRRLYALLLATTFLTAPTPALAEPISTAIGLTALIGGLGVSAGVAGAIGGALITGAIAVGAQLISNTLLGGAVNTEQKPQTESARGTTLNIQYGGALPRQAIMGPGATGGHHVYTNVYGSNNNYLQCVFVVGDGLHGDLTRLWYNGKLATLDTPLGGGGIAGSAITQFRGKPQGGDGAEADIDHVWVRWFNGTTAQTADSELTANANPSTRWTAAHKGVGVCYLSITQRYNDQLGLTGIPDVLIEHEGLMLYDFRLDDTNGGVGPHRWGTPSTYEPSANPVVQEYNFRRGVFIGSQRILGMNVAAGDLVLAMYQAAANICDEAVPLLAGGTEIRYRCAVGLADDRPPSQALEAMRGSMAGFTLERAGQFGPIAGVAQFVYTDLTITDDDLQVGTAAPFSKYRSRSDVATAVHGQFSDPNQKWAAVAFPARELTSDDTLYGEKLAKSIDLTQVYSPSQAQRIAEIMRRRTLQEGSGSLTVGPKWIGVQPGDWLPYNSTRHGNINILVTGVRIDPEKHNVTLTYEKIASTVYSWTTAGEIERPATPIGGSSGTIISAASGMSATQNTIDGANNGKKAAIAFTWTPIYDPSVKRVLFEIRVQSQGEVVQFSSGLPASGAATTTNGVMANSTHEYRHKLDTFPVRPTSWSTWTTVSVGDTDWVQDNHVSTAILINDSATKTLTSAAGSTVIDMDTNYDDVYSDIFSASGTGRVCIIAMVDIIFSLDYDFSTKTLDDARTCDVEYVITVDSSDEKTVYVPALIYKINGTNNLVLPRIMGTFVGSCSVNVSAGSHTLKLRSRSRNVVSGKTYEVTGARTVILEQKKQS